MPPKIKDHRGRLSLYDESLITASIFAAARMVGGKDRKLSSALAKKVISTLNGHFKKTKVLSIEEIEDAIEKVLINEDHVKTAKAYILSRQQEEEERKEKELLGVEDDLGFSTNSLIVMRNKYLVKDENGKSAETPKQAFRRVARAMAAAEEKETVKNGKSKRAIWEEKFYGIMESMEFLPGGRTFANAGTVNGQLANCFVLPMEDNIEEIFEAVKDAAILKKNGGGVGFSFSKIRPKGDLISTTTGQACGPVAIMRVLDASSDILLQAGGRRSGNMVVLAVSHPDVVEFISCKEDDRAFQQINYSLGVYDSFMKAIKKGKRWNLINPRTGRITESISAETLFELASTHAWKNGDPGMIFLDRINKDNPTPHLGSIEAVNLCGEQPLLPYEACNLGSINLLKFVRCQRNTPSRCTSLTPGEFDFDWKRLGEVVRIAVRFLDNVISVCRYPLPKVDRVVKANRKIGLGVMGWADSLIMMGIPYDSEKALKLAEKTMKFITDMAHDESAKLGKEKGSFGNFIGSTWQRKGYKAFRNATCTTIAPTGSISMVVDVSSGIEPLFALSYYKQVMGGVRFPEVNPALVIALKKSPTEETAQVLDEITEKGSVKGIENLPDKIKKVFVTAMDILPEWHVKMQAAFQKYTDNAVSKTINLPQTATVEDIKRAFLLAWELGCKGITVYRDKSKRDQVLNVGMSDERALKKAEGLVTGRTDALCPQCGAKMHMEEGCSKCPSCGYSVCSV